MDAPWGVCAAERQYRNRPGIDGAPLDAEEGRFRLELACFVGVDWGSRTHQACVLDAAGKVVGERSFQHGGAGLTEIAKWLQSFASTAEEIGVAIETPGGRSSRV